MCEIQYIVAWYHAVIHYVVWGWSIVHPKCLAQAQRGSGSGSIRVAASDDGKKDLSWDCGQSYQQGPGDPSFWCFWWLSLVVGTAVNL